LQAVACAQSCISIQWLPIATPLQHLVAIAALASARAAAAFLPRLTQLVTASGTAATAPAATTATKGSTTLLLHQLRLPGASQQHCSSAAATNFTKKCGHPSS